MASKPKLWGELLGQGYEPEEITARLLALEKNYVKKTHTRGTPPRKAAIARQKILLDSIANRRNHSAAPSPAAARRGFDLQKKIQQGSVVLVSDDPRLSFDLSRVLKSTGISNLQAIEISGNAESGMHENICDRLRDEDAIVVCAVTGGGQDAAEIVNRAAIQMARPAIYYRVHGFHVQVGPLVIPGKTACMECFRIRRDFELGPVGT